MTLVCVRLEQSFGVFRITALADTRAAVRRKDDSYKTVSDTTTKLFALPVRCYGLSLTPVTGAWTDPYYETTVGLGFSGECFEALTAISHVGRALSALVTPNDDQPRPTKEGLVQLIAEICRAYYSAHSGDGEPELFLLVFGFEDSKPWIGEITWLKTKTLTSNVYWASADTLATVGQGDLFRQYAGKWRDKIAKHREELDNKRTPLGDDGAFDKELELARHELAERKSTEDQMLARIEDDYFEGIGGVLQKLELAEQNGEVVAGFTHDDRDYLLPSSCSVTPGAELGPVPIVEKMGRRIRQPERNTPGRSSQGEQE